MKLSTLAGADAQLAGPDVEISGLAADSRQVRPGDLFAALAGTKVDGRRFLADAVAKGAAALLVQTGVSVPPDIASIAMAAEPRRALALMAARFHGAQPAHIVAITCTNGR